MPTAFPGGIDSWTNPTASPPGSETLGSAGGGRTHSRMHSDEQDAIEAIETYAGVYRLTLPFGYGDATPEVIGVAFANKVILSVKLVITLPFNSSGASLAVGLVGNVDRLMATDQNYPQAVGTYVTNPATSLGVNANLVLTIVPGVGATQGSGLVVVEIQN